MPRMTPRYRAALLIRLRPRQRDAWRAAAEAEDISMAELVRTAVDTHVQGVLLRLTATDDDTARVG